MPKCPRAADPKWLAKSGYIYFVEFHLPDGSSFYKIGITATNTNNRFHDSTLTFDVLLQEMCPSMQQAYEIEQKLFKRFRHYRFKVPIKFRFAGYTECPKLPGPELDSLVHNMKTYVKSTSLHQLKPIV